MKVLKGYVKNCARSEDCKVECYIAEECVHFYSGYIKQAAKIGVQHGRNEDFVSKTILKGHPISRGKPITMPDDLLEIIHHLVLFNNVEV